MHCTLVCGPPLHNMVIIHVLAVLVKQWEDFDRHPLVDQATRLSYLLASFIQPWTSEYHSLGSRPHTCNSSYKGCYH